MLRDYVENWYKKPRAWKQGWLRWERDPLNYENPYCDDDEKYVQFEDGWNEAASSSAVEGGYHDYG